MTLKTAYFRAVRGARKLDPAVRFLAIELVCIASEDGRGQATNAHLAESVGVTERTIERWVRTLSSEGWFTRLSRQAWQLAVPPEFLVRVPDKPIGTGVSEPDKPIGTAVSEPDSRIGTNLSEPDSRIGQNISAPARAPDPDLTKSSESGTLFHPETSREEGTESTGGADVGSGSDSGSDGTDLADRAKSWLRDPVATGLIGSPESWPEVVGATAYFTEKTGRPVKLTAGHPGIRKLIERYAEGFALREVKRAIDGALSDVWFQQNPQFQTLQTILRDPGQLERFRDLANSNRPPTTRNPNGRSIQPTYEDDLESIESKHEVLRS